LGYLTRIWRLMDAFMGPNRLPLLNGAAELVSSATGCLEGPLGAETSNLTAPCCANKGRETINL